MNRCPTLILFNNVEENTKLTGLIPTICVLLKIFKKKLKYSVEICSTF